MPRKKQTKTIIKIENSEEFKQLVNSSVEEVNALTALAEKSGIDSAEAKSRVASIYLRNLQQSDDIVATAKKNVAELMTRIQLDRAINPEEELVSDKYLKLFKMQNEALKLIASMEPKTIKHSVQVDDDKMVFDVKEGVYNDE